MILGIDPGLRHTGLCLLPEGKEPLFRELKPTGADLLTCLDELEDQLQEWAHYFFHGSVSLIGMERQLSVGGHSSSLMFTVQATILRKVRRMTDVDWVMPLPVQLQSYMKRVHNVDTTSGRTIVKFFQEKVARNNTRISQHCVDAYFLALLARDVKNGTWQYRLPSKEQPLFSKAILNGVSS